ncbi:hypothetical protein RND71_010818 [Anisodus tanguticus]|uniref:Pentatricopeptide repeat-containing protein n=1 Tax=Anisodus tanguticus TaxID=243964 RepID=A0AAE1SL15_9SOLA|nr:hypothetical protein RND71_010818 [Anisodus tanguticus]
MRPPIFDELNTSVPYVGDLVSLHMHDLRTFDISLPHDIELTTLWSSQYLACKRAMLTINEMETVGIKPNVKTYTTHIHGWARASLLEKGLKCFEQMKQSGLKPDKAVYHCLMRSLLSASVAEDNIMTGIQNVCEEMVESGLTVDMGTAVHWSKCSRKIERTGGDITEALQKTFPPDWSSHRTLNDNKEGSDNEHSSSLYEIESDANDDPNFDRRLKS